VLDDAPRCLNTVYIRLIDRQITAIQGDSLSNPPCNGTSRKIGLRLVEAVGPCRFGTKSDPIPVPALGAEVIQKKKVKT
jgi:hypothetical protein